MPVRATIFAMIRSRLGAPGGEATLILTFILGS
jgi:hypothetical protein